MAYLLCNYLKIVKVFENNVLQDKAEYSVYTVWFHFLKNTNALY